MNRRLTLLVCGLFAVTGLITPSADATLITTSPCTLNKVTLTSMTQLGNNTNLLTQSHNASACIGVFGGENDDDHGYSDPSPNIGQFNDGLLNGEGGELTGLEFIQPSDRQDLDGDGNFTDPGWIHLANFNPAGGSIMYDQLGPVNGTTLDIADLIDFSFTCTPGLSDCKTGTWQLNTSLDIIQDVQALLGPSVFDHLAFSIKAGNAFVVYDFNFNQIFDLEKLLNPASTLNLNTAYNLGGTFDTSDITNKQGTGQAISHMNIWARDPADATITRVPEPAPVALLALGLMGLMVGSRRTTGS